METEDDLTLGGGHAVRYTDRVSQECTPATYMTLRTSVTLLHFI